MSETDQDSSKPDSGAEPSSQLELRPKRLGFFAMNLRSLKNLFIVPGLQIRHLLISGSVSILLSAVLNFLFLAILLQKLAEPGLFAVQARGIAVFEGVLNWGLTLLSGLLLLGITSLVIAIRQSHRVAGPVFKINQMLEDLIDGHFEAQLKLRTHDELQDVAEKLNTLAAKLQQTKPWTLDAGSAASSAQNE